MAIRVVDRAIQSFGAEGVSQDTFLAVAAAHLRTLRLADVSDWSYDYFFLPLFNSFYLGSGCCKC